MEINEHSANFREGLDCFVTPDDPTDEDKSYNADKEQGIVDSDTVIVDGSNDERDQSDAAKEHILDDLACLGDDSFDLNGSLVGLKRQKVEDIYDLYCEHARRIGFTVRKSTTRNNHAGVVVEKYYVCSCEGSKRTRTSSSNNQEQEIRRKTAITRTYCKASLRLKMNDDGVYEVIDHNTLHNHALTRKEWSHKAERSINKEKGSVIESMISSGMRATPIRYLAQDAGGEESVGHTMNDHWNFVSRYGMGAIEGDDAQTLIDALHQQAAGSEDFFFRVKLDQDGRLSNVFWRDSLMKEDYMVYGDVVVFDTTYRTNKYNLICAPFVGINNHWKNVMFGCAFITEETAESFEWLFGVFKKSMEGKCPVSIFTDHDFAIEKAVIKVFHGTRHRLCVWHLYQDAVGRFENLKGDKGFSDIFQKCLSGCIDEEEFKDCWSSMISNYDLKDNSWFAHLYLLREKWCTAINKDFFSAGILSSSQQSESTDSTVGFNAKKTTSLSQFYTIFNRTVQTWRRNEIDDEFHCSRAQPTSFMPLTGLIKHASEVYTLTLFKDFEDEFLKSISTTCEELHSDERVKFYSVKNDVDGTTYDVSFSEMDKSIVCSCKRFEECGLLCRHCLRIFHMHSLVQIPDCYIKRRWTKMAKAVLWEKNGSGTEQSNKTKDCTAWRNQMMRRVYNLILKVQEDAEGRKIFEDGFETVAAQVEALMTTLHSTEETEVSSSSIDMSDHAHSTTKERKKRTKEHLQKSKKKTCDASNSEGVWFQNS